MKETQPTLQHLDSQRAVWEQKPLIRELYGRYHKLLLSHCVPGSIIEIGAGCGNLKSTRDDVISVDIVVSPWVDVAADAQQLPFADGSVGNLVMLDVLHHIPRPLRFLDEAARVLQPGGRVVMLEPGITPVSELVYRTMHPEPVDMGADVFSEQALSGDDPFDSNQAVATLLFVRDAMRLTARTPQLELHTCSWLGPLSYPLSGGFRPWQLLNRALLNTVLAVEKRLPQAVLSKTAFRLLAVLEKHD